jgi:hypothetical protein
MADFGYHRFMSSTFPFAASGRRAASMRRAGSLVLGGLLLLRLART